MNFKKYANSLVNEKPKESKPEPEPENLIDKKGRRKVIEEVPVYKRPMTWAIGIGAFIIARSIFGGPKRVTVRGDMYLSKNFRVGEFLRSKSIPELKEYKLTEKELKNLNRLAMVLQNFRDDIGAPIVITSGGRPPHLKATEGKYKGMNFVQILRAKNYSPSEFSQHMDFSGADFTTRNKEWLPHIMRQMTNPYFSSAMGKSIMQVILYIENGYPDFIHLGVASDINDFERITAGKRLLLAEVRTFTDESGKKKRTTKYHKYSPVLMDGLIVKEK